jgi:hypothetical protein
MVRLRMAVVGKNRIARSHILAGQPAAGIGSVQDGVGKASGVIGARTSDANHPRLFIAGRRFQEISYLDRLCKMGVR